MRIRRTDAEAVVEFAQALLDRNERRRKTFTALINRVAGKSASVQARKHASTPSTSSSR
jgi:hypothetical protein